MRTASRRNGLISTSYRGGPLACSFTRRHCQHQTHSIKHIIQSSLSLPSAQQPTTPKLHTSMSSPTQHLPAFSTMTHPTAPSSSTPLPYIPLTLVLCLRPHPTNPSTQQILLGLKKRGFGAGRFNGFGGKLQPNESIHTAAQRELTEECGLIAASGAALIDTGIIVQRFIDRPDKHALVIHVLRCDEWVGEVCESDEMAPCWVDVSDMPYVTDARSMWADDCYWYPLVFRGACFVADFVMEGMDRVVAGGVDECSAERLRQWSWEQHSSEEWRATVQFEKEYRAGSKQQTAVPP